MEEYKLAIKLKRRKLLIKNEEKRLFIKSRIAL